MINDERYQQTSSRSNCYGLLALVFRDALAPEVIAQLRSPPLTEALSGLDYDAAKDLGGDLETVTENLREEYTAIFVGPGPHVPPYGSVHHPEECQLWGDSTVRVKRFIEMTGLSFEGDWDSIPDHIAVELEVMQRLAAHEAELWRQGAHEELDRCVQSQSVFLRKHLCPWVPHFCDAVSAKSVTSFYRKMAELAKSVVLSDVEEMKMVKRPF